MNDEPNDCREIINDGLSRVYSNELKTLKEIQYINREDRTYAYCDDLKAEAVKWAKYCTYKANQKFADDTDIRFWTAKRVGLMEFFNLTEEDLI